MRVKCTQKTEGGVAVDVGAGGEFGGKAEDDEGVNDAEETKIDQFWNFPAIENEVNFASFADFKKNYWMPFLTTFQKLAVERKAVKDEGEMKQKGKKMANNAGKWLKAHFDELQFYTLESWFRDGSELDAKYDGLNFACNIGYLRYVDGTPYFYFLKDAFLESKF